MNQVFLVVYELKGGVVILEVCDEPLFAQKQAEAYSVTKGRPCGVMIFDVHSAPVEQDYRVRVYFGERGIEYRVELCLSIPVAWDVFDPSSPYRDHHGSIVVKATSEDRAIERAKKVMSAYVNDMPITVKLMVPRREGYVGVAGSVS